MGSTRRASNEEDKDLFDIIHYRYVENFSNGVTIICLYLMPLDPNRQPSIETTILQVMKEASLMYCLPTTPLHTFFQSGHLSVQETVYGYLGLVFAQHFLNRLGSEYGTLASLLNLTDPSQMDVLGRLKKRLREETFTREYILEIVKSHPELIRAFYLNFASDHYVLMTSSMHRPDEDHLRPSLSYQRIQTTLPLSQTELAELVRQRISDPNERMVWEALLTFNRHILKTNFYQPTKVAISVCLDPAFLPQQEYPSRPFGLFLVVGSEFRGFHLRFRDVARGGIRIIGSRNREAYSINLRSLFDENYALAATQQRKNKDIPEGGSKGTILLDVDKQDKAKGAFEKYIDALLDLLLVGQTPGIKERIVDRRPERRPEILFLGPDEGTADLMDWASQHARHRGATFWKAFTTGKSQALGGIPHDLYGMTTTSIRAYVEGIYERLGLQQETVTKFQTGGPDGDLGSNEIKMSRERTLAIVDGSGVIYDPAGLCRDELVRLANLRQTIANFSPDRLGPGAFRVLVEDRNVQLPTGEWVEDGLAFRNSFHLHPLSTADLFVPCGGRPEAVNVHNVSKLFHDRDGSPRFKYIVEGANLFFTQEARLRLEAAGVIIFKDASANKGGVTSSSMEVMAALTLSDAEFAEHMQLKSKESQDPLDPSTKDYHPPPFYQAYVEAVKENIRANALLEFGILWREHQQRGTPRSTLSDELSGAINQLGDQLQASDTLWGNPDLRRRVLADAIPPILQDVVGEIDQVMQRLPETYLRALFGAYLASRFIYDQGMNPSQFAFYEYMAKHYHCQA